jgi:hypothetical protein
LEAPNPLRRRINSANTDGNESIGFNSHHGMLWRELWFTVLRFFGMIVM